MTVSIQISVNGNYKLPVTIKQGEREETHVVSGRGSDGPKVLHVPFYHGPEIMTITAGPESQDNGETEDEGDADNTLKA